MIINDYSARINCPYALQPKLDIGVELMRAQRELESGADDDFNRLPYSFPTV